MTGSKFTKKIVVTEERFQFFVTLFRISGVSLIKKGEPKFYFFYSLLITFCGFSLAIGCTVDSWIHIDDMDHLFQNARLVLPATCALAINIFFRLRRKTVENLMNLTENFTWEGNPTRDLDTGDATTTALISYIKPFVKRFLIIILIYHAIYCVIRINIIEDKPLTINAYYFFNTSMSPIYEIVNISQYFGALMWVTSFNGFLGFNAYLVAIACSQLEKLSLNMMSIKEMQTDEGSVTETCQEEERELQINAISRHIKIQLSDCIRHHQEIMTYMRALEDTLSPLLMGLFLFIFTGLCASAFSFVVGFGNFLQMAQAFLTYIVPMIQLYAFCWFGQELTDQASDIANAVWKSHWVGAPISYQRSLVLIMLASQRKFVLTAGKFVPVSRGTIENVFKQTLSLLMFLLKMKNKDVI